MLIQALNLPVLSMPAHPHSVKISYYKPCGECYREYNARRFAGRKHEKLRRQGYDTTSS